MEKEINLAILITLAWMSTMVLILTLLLFYQRYRAKIHLREKENAELLREKQIAIFKASVEAEEHQKEKIAYNLHDEIVPLLTSVAQNIAKHTEDLKQGNLGPAALVEDGELLKDSIQAIRNVAHDLVPKSVLHFGVIRALENHIAVLKNSQAALIEAENRSGFETELPFAMNEQVSIYRLCLELLNNLKKHARYDYLRVVFETTGRFLKITFSHDGKGISNEQINQIRLTSTGIGLKSIESRLLVLNAEIDYQADEDVATITVLTPFTHDTSH